MIVNEPHKDLFTSNNYGVGNLKLKKNKIENEQHLKISGQMKTNNTFNYNSFLYFRAGLKKNDWRIKSKMKHISQNGFCFCWMDAVKLKCKSRRK